MLTLPLLTESNMVLGVEHSNKVYATWTGLGPDKWASIWLVQRYLSPKERVLLLPYNSRPPSLKLFDIPETQFYRTTDATTFAQLRSAHQLSAPAFGYMAAIIHDIEINLWLPDTLPLSRSVEDAFRAMQDQYGRTGVPYSCYMAFFDALNGVLQAPRLPENFMFEVSTGSAPCAREPLRHLSMGDQLVPQVPIAELLDLMRGGMQPVFLDVREPEEFAESHIPGARNTLIRDFSKALVQDISNAELVVVYCVKDFRAFEMAHKLRVHGVDRAVILQPFGLKGWISTGLPVVRSGLETDAEGLFKLEACIQRADSCQATQ